MVPDSTVSDFNTYTGGAFQQATSYLTKTSVYCSYFWNSTQSVCPCLDPDCYELTQGCFAVYGFEYKPGYNDGYISWIANDKVAYAWAI